MMHEEFRIGLEFWCGGRRWRCTDVGSRVIVAICLDPHEVVSLGIEKHARGKRRERRSSTVDPAWFNGPPYAVVEFVFDEYSLPGCSLTKEEDESVPFFRSGD